MLYMQLITKQVPQTLHEFTKAIQEERIFSLSFSFMKIKKK